MYDVIIIGAGAAGLTAAVYCRRAEKSVLLIEKNTAGGQIGLAAFVENYPGADRVSGTELADSFYGKAEELGAELYTGEVIGIENGGEVKTVYTADNKSFSCFSVIISVGVSHRKLGVPGEEELIGRGVSFCALCDGAFYKGKEVAVAGGGNTALSEAVFLSDIAKNVYVIQNRDRLTGEEHLIKDAYSRKNIEFIKNASISALEKNDGSLSAVLYEQNGEKKRLRTDGVFVAIGFVPDNSVFENILSLDENGYIKAGENCKTEIPGIFAAGDCRTKDIRQLTTAAADGTAAGIAASEHVDKMRRNFQI